MKQSLYQQSIDRYPDRSTPVGVPPEHTCFGFGRNILNFEFLASDPETVRMIQMITRQGANPVRAEELLFVEHVFKDAFQFSLVRYRKQTAFVVADKAAVSQSNMFDDVRVALVEQINKFGQPRQTGRLTRFQRGRRTQRQQAN